MPRPTTKQDLITAANDQFEKLWNLMDGLSEKELTTEFDFEALNKPEAHWKRDKNVKDVLVHLYEWHQLFINWNDSNSQGKSSPFLPTPYTWKTYGAMNVKFWEKHQTTTLEQAKEKLLESHKKVICIFEGYSNEELFAKEYFSWTGANSIGSYCVSVTSSHYDWAIKKIKLHKKILKANQ